VAFSQQPARRATSPVAMRVATRSMVISLGGAVRLVSQAVAAIGQAAF
jgi:hypothetical protein